MLQKLIRSRERGVEVAGRTFTIRRPTDAEALAMEGRDPFDFVRRFVVGWDLTEGDVLPGGGPEKIAFDAELWAEWAADHPELWSPLALAIVDDFKRHVEEREGAEKN